MTLNGKFVLVTGSEGFIGSHLVEALINQGAKIRCFVLYNSFNSWGWLDELSKKQLKSIEIFTGDIRDPNGVRKAMEGVEVVFHLAALIAIPFSYHSPDSYVDTNIRGTLNILQAARDLGIKRVIHTSTSEVYGSAQYIPMNEEHPLQGQSPYSATKIGADQMALSFYRSFDSPIVIIRPFNTFGPRQSARAVIPTIISQIASGKRKLDIGTTTPTRDFNFVTDIVRGFVKASTARGIEGEIINLGTGKEISIHKCISKISSIMKVRIEIATSKERTRPEKSEVARLCADNSKALRMLKWKPEKSFEEGLEKTISWFTNPANLKLYKTERYNI
jgi:NAD dependent epimerase/dehydratase